MDHDRFAFNRGAIRPLQCLTEAWHLIKGEYWFFLGVTFVGFLIAELGPLGLLLGPAMCGIHICLLRQMNGQRVSFDMLFQGFNYFGQSLIAALFIMAPLLVITVVYMVGYFAGMIGFFKMAGPQQNQMPDWSVFAFMIGWTLAFVVILSLVSALFTFVFPLIVDRELTGWEAVRTSVRAVFANLGGVFGLLILETLLGVLGELACCVGVIFVMPISFAMTAVAYRQVFPVIDPYADMPLDPEPPAPVVTPQEGHIQSHEPKSSALQDRPSNDASK